MSFKNNLPPEPDITPLFERHIPETRIDLHMASDHLRKSYAEVERERLAGVALANGGDRRDVSTEVEKPPTPQAYVERVGAILLSTRRRRALGSQAVGSLENNFDMPNAA